MKKVLKILVITVAVAAAGFVALWILALATIMPH